MKTVIIFASTHHGNTKKVAEYMAKIIAADLIDITQNLNPDISAYDIVGFASGIYFHSFHEAIKKFICNTVFNKNQKVFLVDTCGVAKGHPSQQELKKAENFIKNIISDGIYNG